MDKRLPNEHAWSRRLADWEKGPEGPSPDPAVWDRLKQSLNKKKRRPPVIWGAAGLLALVVAIIMFSLSEEESGGIAVATGSSSGLTLDATRSSYVGRSQVLASEGEPRGVRSTRERSEASSASIRKQMGGATESTLGATRSSSGLTLDATRSSYVGRSQVLASEEEPRGVRSTRERSVSSLASTRERSVSPLASIRERSEVLPVRTRELSDFTLDVAGAAASFPSDATRSSYVGRSQVLAGKGERSQVLAIGLHTAFNRPEVRAQIPSSVFRAQSIAKNISTSIGFRLRLEISDKWSLTTGFSRSIESSEHQLVFVQPYRSDQEVTDPDGSARTTYQTDFATDYSKAGADIEIVRPADTELPANFWLRLGVSAQEEVETISVPVLIAYDQPVGQRLRLRLASGLAWNRQNISLDLQSRLSNARELNIRQSRVRSNEQFLNQDYWTAQFQAGIALRTGKQWEFALSPQFSTSLTRLGEDRNLNVGFQQVSIVGEVYYRFNR
ncbi:MAG: hypothetical protein AAF741_05360 [Bacteroidota bacterium]